MSAKKQIGEVANELGLNPKTIRYYEEIGLIPKAGRNEVGYRLYDQPQIDRLAFIIRARALDFSLDEIREILALRERGEAPCLYVSERVQQRLEVIDSRIAALRRLRDELQEIQEIAHSLPHQDIIDKGRVCHLIENQSLVANQE